VAKPLLPRTAELTRYLDRIDGAQIYTNFGPLNAQLERIFSDRCSAIENHAVTGANATLLLVAAITKLSDKRRGSANKVIVPAWTFSATAQAVLQAGLVPKFVDVGLESWCIEPSDVSQHLDPDVCLIIPVIPFGDIQCLKSWESFARQVDIPVLVDAATGFDGFHGSSLPTVISLHATKVLSSGEGGVLYTPDEKFADNIRSFISFGFAGTNKAESSGLNAKLSEYHAAIGLASMDSWTKRRETWVRIKNRYLELLGRFSASGRTPMESPFASSVFCLHCSGGEDADSLAKFLSSKLIGSKKWWGESLPKHPAFVRYGNIPTPNADLLSRQVLGLPCFQEVTDAQIEYVADSIRVFYG